MAFLVDTNVLLRSADSEHPMNADATNATNILLEQGDDVCIVAQNLIEFWNVYTRPANRNGLGYSPGSAAEEIQRLKGLFLLLPERPTIYAEWERLVVNYDVSGVNVHDARLVAAMCVHGLTHILTFNVRDFSRYAEIKAVHPTEICENFA